VWRIADPSQVAYDLDKRPGEWVTAKAQGYSRQLRLILAVTAVLMWIAAFTGFGLRSTTLTVAIVVVMVVLYRVFDSHELIARRWTEGARAETLVGETLNELKQSGFVVMHDVEQEYEGNIDHLVSGPTGVYMIETKSRAYLAEQLRKAKRQAAKLGGELGVWVTPVICLNDRPRSQPFRHHGVWIVPRHALLDWLLSQRNQVLAFQRLAYFADGV
jgi:hypothetical protein